MYIILAIPGVVINGIIVLFIQKTCWMVMQGVEHKILKRGFFDECKG